MYEKTTEKLAFEKELANNSGSRKNADTAPMLTPAKHRPATRSDGRQGPGPTAAESVRQPGTETASGDTDQRDPYDRSAASAGVTFTIRTSRVARHSAMPTAPVRLIQISIAGAMLRGYLNNSSHDARDCSGSVAGSWIRRDPL
jgi:hypothetical protein